MAGKLAPPFGMVQLLRQRERRELAVVNRHANAAVSRRTQTPISPTTEMHPGVGANT
jgi:hypothetical protein